MEISIEHLNKNYGKQNVLKDISLHIPIGMYGMLGENGAKKEGDRMKNTDQGDATGNADDSMR